MANNTLHVNTGTYGVNDAPAVGPLMQGQAGVVMTFTLTDLGGTAVNITGLTITGTIRNTQTGATAALQGAIALVTPASGIFSWTTHEDDVGTAGEFMLTFKSGTSLITLPAYLSVIETPAATTTFGAALVGVTVAEAAWLTAALAALPDASDLATISAPDVDDLTTATGNSTEMVRVAAAGGLEYRTPAQVLSDIGAAAAASLANYLPLAGGTMSGNIAMSGAQTVDGVDVSALGSTVSGHVSSTSNPHSVTAAQAGALPLDGAILSKSGAYQLAAGDEGKIIECNGTFTVTAPNGLDAGFQVALVNVGAGIITVAASTTLQAKGAKYTLANQYGMATLYHRGSNVWLLAGDLT